MPITTTTTTTAAYNASITISLACWLGATSRFHGLRLKGMLLATAHFDPF